jgi:hypothetical protein
MVSMSLFVELLRTRPRMLFWAMVGLQLVLWTFVPALFYAAPPGQLPLVLAIGHEFQFGTEFGPPLAFWLAEIAYRVAGMTGVYLLSQICIAVALWAVFALGRSMVGASHAAIAVMLMAGIAVLSVPTPEFGPAILATPLWGLVLLHYWTAAVKGGWIYWVALGLEAGLLILTSYTGLILLGVLVIYMLSSEFGRSQCGHIGPWLAGVAMTAVLFPYLIWLDLSAGPSRFDLAAIAGNFRVWGWLVLALALSHTGMAILVLLGHGALMRSQDTPPEISRAPVPPPARGFVYFFALAPILGMGLLALFTRQPENFLAAPLVLLSGLAAVMAAGDRIRIERQYLIGYVWATLIVLPPFLVAMTVVLQPWILAADLRIGRPAGEIGRFFGDSFARRTGRLLTVVAGDEALASLVALGAPSRPSLYVTGMPDEHSRITRQDIADEGAVVVWPATDTAGRPPPEIGALFPDLAVEVPRAFARAYQGRMPLMRIGWGMIRPREQASASDATVPRQVEPQPTMQSSPELAPEPQGAPLPPQSPQAQVQSQQAVPASGIEPPQSIAPQPTRPPRRQHPRPRPFQKMHGPQ